MGSTYYSLVYALTVSDFKLRYHGSFLGVFWSFLKPLFLFSVLYTVFSVFMRFPVPHYGLYLLLGIIIWNFFAEATTLSLKSMVLRAPLIRKIYFPRNILVISSTLIAFLNLMVNLCVFALIYILAGMRPSLSLLTLVFWIALLYTFALGCSLGLSALNVRLKDIEHLWDVLLPLGLWVTPVVYSVSMVPSQYHWVFALNPIASIIDGIRGTVLNNSLPTFGSLYTSTIITALIFAVGYALFEWYAPSFAEEL